MQKIFQTENNRNNTEIESERVNEKLFKTQLCVIYYLFPINPTHWDYKLDPEKKPHHKQKEKKKTLKMVIILILRASSVLHISNETN